MTSRMDAIPSREDDEAVTGIVDPVQRAWAEAYEAAPERCRWTKEDVDDALEWAHRMLRRMPVRVMPREFSSNWPGYVNEEAAAGASRDAATPEEVSEIDRILCWVGDHVRDPRENYALRLWCACFEYGGAFRTKVQENGGNIHTMNRRRRRGAYRVAAALCLAEVGLTERAMQARVARASKAGGRAVEEPREHELDPGTVVPAGPGPGEGTDDALWAEIEAAQAIPDEAVRALHIADLIAAHVRAVFAGAAADASTHDRMRNRGSSLTRLATARGLLDPRAGRRGPGALTYVHEHGAAVVRARQEPGGARWTYEIEGPRADVSEAVAEIEARYPAEAYGTRFLPPRAARAGVVVTSGERRASPAEAP